MQHHKTWERSRMREWGYEWIPCELQLVCRGATAIEIHHGENSFRGKRNDNDPTKLIATCRGCHDEIHRHNNFENRQIIFHKIWRIINLTNTLGRALTLTELQNI